MVSKVRGPKYDLVEVKAAANQLNFEKPSAMKTDCQTMNTYVILLSLAMKGWRLTSCTSNIASLKAAW